VFNCATSFLGIEWGLDETAERLIRAGRLRPFLAVAVANSDQRIAEYTPAAETGRGGGRAADYARFLVEELKPLVDSSYRTLKGPAHTGAVGASLGGVVSAYLGAAYPEVFGLVGAVSPTAGWAGGDIVHRIAAAPRPGLRVWVDIGESEATPYGGVAYWLEGARSLRDAYLARGYREGVNFHYEEVPGAGHNEAAWAARVDRILEFLLGPPETPSAKQ
jgi:enterochelin esterase-like enzyme